VFLITAGWSTQRRRLDGRSGALAALLVGSMGGWAEFPAHLSVEFPHRVAITCGAVPADGADMRREAEPAHRGSHLRRVQPDPLSTRAAHAAW